VILIRYTSYGFLTNIDLVDEGTWPIFLNAVFNSLAHYLFILSLTLVFLPIFMGKLSILRDICASSFFRPLSRLSYSALMIQSLMLFYIFFTHEQSIYYDHKNMMFIYFSLVFFTYIASVFVALFLEYPFRTMSKVVFSPPKKILRLNRELARELNTNGDRMVIEYNESELEESMSEVNSQIKGRDQMFEDIEDVEDVVGEDREDRGDEDRPQSKKALDLSLQMPGGGGGGGMINNSTFS